MYPVQELYVLLITVYGGIVMGIIYDLYRAIRWNFNRNKIITFIEDLLFWTSITIIGFVILHRTNAYDLRYYNFTGFILGIIIYFNTISKYILKVFTKIIRFILKVVKQIIRILVNLYYAIIYPIHVIFDIIIYMITLKFKRSSE